MKTIVYDALSVGRENAVPLKQLAKQLGFRSVRDLQKQVEAERKAGAVILSDSQGAGYYLSDDPEELAKFTQRMERRAKNTLNAVRSAQLALDNLTGQQRIEGM